MTDRSAAAANTAPAPWARPGPDAIGVAQDTVIGMALSAPAASVGLTLAAFAAATACGSGPIILLAAIPVLVIATAYHRLNMWNANCGAPFEWVGRAINAYLGFLTRWLMISACRSPLRAFSAGYSSSRCRPPRRHRSGRWPVSSPLACCPRWSPGSCCGPRCSRPGGRAPSPARGGCGGQVTQGPGANPVPARDARLSPHIAISPGMGRPLTGRYPLNRVTIPVPVPICPAMISRSAGPGRTPIGAGEPRGLRKARIARPFSVALSEPLSARWPAQERWENR